MRFEIHETVQTPDPEVVLRALEMCSREISSEVVRSGDRITLRGVGPSPRSKNNHDTTVFCVNVENNETVIQGEVNFQASALLGETSQQEVVRSKLDELFEQMKAQIHLDSMRVAAYAAARRSAASSTTGTVSSTTVIDRPEDPSAIELRELDPSEAKAWLSEEKAASAVTPETMIEAMTAAPDSGWGAAALIDLDEPQGIELPDQRSESRYAAVAEPPAVPPIEHLPADVKADIKEGPVVKDGPERATGAIDSVPTAAQTQAQTAGPTRPTAAKQIPVREAARNSVSHPKPNAGLGLEEELTWKARIPPSRFGVEEDRTSNWNRFARGIAVLATLLALAGVGYRLYSLHPDLFAYPASIVAKYIPAATKYIPPPTAPAPLPAPLPTAPLPSASEAPLAKTSSPMPSPPAPTAEPVANNAELKRWLQGWAASMQTRDADAQASFYADKLDRYLDQRNVGRSAVLRDREATIRMRKGLWTVKMEDIVIERHTESEAEVRLTKHFIGEPEQSEILESFVPTRLTLKRINGQWKITSEQDQPTISVSPWKAQGGVLRDQDMQGMKKAQSSTACVGGCVS